MAESKGKLLTIEYNDKVCIRAGKCVARLPAVHDQERTPWIDPDQGDEESIKATVKVCPSSALTVKPTDAAAR